MADTIILTGIPCDRAQIEELTGLFASPGYSTLKRVLVSHCIKEQVQAANKALYQSTSEIASSQATNHRTRAEYIKALIDVLDDIESKEDQWFIVSLECKR